MSDGLESIARLQASLEEAREPRERLRLLAETGERLWLRGAGEARQVLEQLLDEATTAGDAAMVSKAACLLADMMKGSGRLEDAARLADLALAEGKRSGMPRLEAAAWNAVGTVHYERAEYPRAQDCFDRCLAMSRADGYRAGELAALNQLGNLMGIQGRVHDALDCYERCLAIDREMGSTYGEVVSRINVGWMHEKLGRWEEAAGQFYRAIALSEQHGFHDWQMLASCNLGELFVKRRRLDQAIDLFSVVVAEEKKHEPPRSMLGIALTHLGQAMLARGDIGAATATYLEADRLLARLDDKYDMAILSVQRAELSLVAGNLAECEELLGRAAELSAEQGLRVEQGEVMRVRARLFAERGESEAARDCFERAMGEFAETPESFEMARTCLQYGRYLAKSGDATRARALLRQAVGTFRRLSVVAETEEANRLLIQLDVPERGTSALLAGLQGLERVNLEPVSFVREALRLVCAGLGFEAAALVHGTAPVENFGTVESESPGRLVSLALGEVAGSDVLLLFQPSVQESAVADQGVLDAVASIVAGPARRLVESRPAPGAAGLLPGLRYSGVIGRCRAAVGNLEVIARVADTPVPVLVRGESGTGKELIARAVHESSGRCQERFVAINCAAVPEGLLEAEFFGVTKGAATGVAARRGKFELANGGTVFLDEVGDMSPGLQAKLLRVLQEGEFEPVGGGRTVEVDVRVVAATNQDVDKLIREGRFRSDLYYRLNAIEVVLPPLRERREDIPEFVRFFIKHSNQVFSRSVLGVSDETLGMLLAYDWPGNIRELKHVIERAVILARDEMISAEDLPVSLRPAAPGEDESLKGRMREARQKARARAEEDVDKALLLDCLERAGWNISAAAQLAGYSRAQFYRLLKRHDISRP